MCGILEMFVGLCSVLFFVCCFNILVVWIGLCFGIPFAWVLVTWFVFGLFNIVLGFWLVCLFWICLCTCAVLVFWCFGVISYNVIVMCFSLLVWLLDLM